MGYINGQDKVELIERVSFAVVENYSRRGVEVDADLIARHLCKAVFGEILQAQLKEIRAIVQSHIQAHTAMSSVKVLLS